MPITKINLNKAAKLDFDIKIDGINSNEKISAYFYIETGLFSLCFTGISGTNSYSFNIPSLKGIVPIGVYACKLCIVCEENIFTPLVDSVELFVPVVVSSSLKTTTTAPTTGISVSLSGVNNLNSASAIETDTNFVDILDTIVQTNESKTFNNVQIQPDKANKLLKYVSKLAESKKKEFSSFFESAPSQSIITFLSKI